MYTSPVDAEHHAHAHGAWWYLPSPATQQQQQYPAMQYQSIEQQSYPTQATTYSARQQQQQQLTHSYFAPQPQPEPLTLRGGHTVPSSSGSHHHQQQQTPQHHRSQYEQDPGPGPSHQPSHPQPPPHPHPPPLIPQSQSQSPSAHRTVVRRSYHPNPPAHRSEWVMWVGNVPSDAAYDELWRFFTSDAPNPTPTASTGTDAAANPAGVLSIFLIARSNCAFVNYASEAQLHAGIDAFHGTPLRPTDPRAQRLVCRTRYKDDDLTAGVGAQRGVGVHMKWVREHREETPPSVDGEAEQASMSSASVSVSDEDASAARMRGAGEEGSSSASTTSSVLARYFPKRYFILKSLSQFDLDLSGILDQAFRTSRESGEFYGYARYNGGPSARGEYRVSWARVGARPRRPPLHDRVRDQGLDRGLRPAPPQGRSGTGKIVDGKTDKDNLFFSPREKRLVDESPLPLTDGAGGSASTTSQQQQEQPPAYAHAPPPAAPARLPASAPSVLGRPHHSMSFSTPPMKHPTFEGALGGCVPVPAPTESSAFELDEAAPIRAIRGHVGGSGEEAGVGAGARLQAVVEEEERGAVDEEAVGGMGADWDRKETGKVKETEAEVETRRHAEQDGWGESFRVEWLCTERLPFARIRHLRNPWNHDREVKISRDGTELEPSVGEQLLAEWATRGNGEEEDDTRSAPPCAPREDAGQIRP
ncbi:YT521-B-like domain-containing protein [Infundibulicybe gibba]|nr:YT521-B-like domain-containing protein [Infundibulicybe gibba]